MTKRAIHAASSSRWLGAVEGIHQGHVYGWAVDTQRMDARVLIEVCHNSEVVGYAVADVARNDLQETFMGLFPDASWSDCCHGFVADIGSVGEQAGVQLSVRVANSDHVLPGAREVAAPPIPIAGVASFVYGDGSLRIHGWISAALGRVGHPTVRAFVGSRQVAVSEANLPAPRVRPLGDKVLGFALDLPLECADGKVHSVRIVDQEGRTLHGSPVHVCAYATGIKQLIGCADMASIDLLRSVIDSYEQYLPRGVGWVHYQQWAKAFEPMASTKAQKSRSVHRGAGGKLRVGILVVDDGDPVDCQRTDASLHGLRDANIRVFGPTASRRARSSFGERLVQALDAKCEVIACVRAGDTLTPLAMHYALAGFDDAQVQVVYTDSEYAGKPWFKPAWNPDYAWGSDYLLDLMLMRADTVRELLMAKVELDNAADLAWQMLAQVWRNGTHAIVHVPRVLYHFHSPLREIEHQSRLCASRKALGRVEPNAVLEQMPLPTVDSLFLPRRLHRSLTKRDRTKSISLIIPTRDRVELLQRCIASLERFTDSKNVEIIVVDNDSIQTKTLTYLRQIARKGIRVLPFPGAFNFSAMNNRAVAAASGEIVGLINNDIEALHDGWLEEMLSHLLSPGVGAVGAKLLWPNDMVQHGGVLLGMGNAAGHFGNLLMDQDWGDHGRNQLVQHVSGVTAACMLVRKKDYLAVGGLDEAAFPVAFNDVDFCLKLRSLGMSIVWTPHARLLHAESASRGHEDTPQKKARAQRELQELRRRWFGVLLRDPAYHPSLSLDSHSQAFGGLASPPRDRSPRTGKLCQHL